MHKPRSNADGHTNGSLPPGAHYPDHSRNAAAGSDSRQNANPIPREVLELHGAGFSVVPCRADKKPLVRWIEYQKRQPTLEELHRWSRIKPACWAVVTGRISGVVVLDFDGPEGAQTLQNLGLKAHIKTPSGGFHVYVTLPEGVTVRTTNAKSDRLLGELYRGTDVRADGGYAVACGRNIKGEYKLLRPLIPDPWDSLPDELREYLTGNPNHAKAKRLLEKALSKAVVGCRNDVGFELACALRDALVPETSAERKRVRQADAGTQHVPTGAYQGGEILVGDWTENRRRQP